MQTKRSYGLNVGTSSILVIIVILCLICFAGLSIASANADLRLSQKLAERTSSYYEACNNAQITVKNLSSDLASIYAESNNELEYQKKVKESLADSLTFSYTVNDNQMLQVSVLPLYPETPSGDYLRITQWQITNITSPELDESLPVYLGN